MSIPKGLYKHFKGAMYKVLDVAIHSETDEQLVIYQRISAADKRHQEKEIWARPLSIFTEQVNHQSEIVPRFTYVTEQSEVLEVAVLNVIVGLEVEFETAFAKAQSIISGMSGYISHQLKRCIEHESRYILLVEWQTLEDHTVGFRQSDEYQQWRDLLHHFYSPFPVVEHYQCVD